MRRLVLVFLLLLVTRVGFASGALLLMKNGSLIRSDNDGTSQTLYAGYAFGKGGAEDACYSTRTQTLYCIDMDARIYRIRPFGDNPQYSRIPTAFSAGGLMLDDLSSSPVTCRFDDNGTDHLVAWTGGNWVTYQGNTPLFDRISLLSPGLLPDGFLSTDQLVTKCPYTSACLHTYPGQSEWAALGRNGRCYVYGLVVADTTAIGQPFPNILLVMDSVATTATVVTVPESGVPHVYKDHIVVRGDVEVKNEAGGGPEQFTGNFYVHDLRTSICKKYELGDSYNVLGASRDLLYLGEGNRIYVQPIGTAQGDLRLFATFSTDYVPLKVFPLD